jgi:hypothetical protein
MGTAAYWMTRLLPAPPAPPPPGATTAGGSPAGSSAGPDRCGLGRRLNRAIAFGLVQHGQLRSR